MDPEERRFLKAAIRVQQSKEYGFILDGKTITTCANIQSSAEAPKTVKSEQIQLSFLSQDYLEGANLISTQGTFAPTYYVTESGWNYFRNKRTAFLQFVCRGFFVPVAVSVATTMITLWIQGLL